MGDANQNNSNMEPQQGYGSSPRYDHPYYNGQPPYGSGQYYGQNADYGSGQYYGPDAGYNSGQYYGQNTDYGSGQYYGPDAGYNSGQYYGQNAGYGNGQYYGPNPGYDNGQYYRQNAGYGNGQYYGPNPGYDNGQYYGYGQPPYPNSAFAQPAGEPVSNLFYYILMALTAVSSIVTVSVTISMIRSLGGIPLFSGAAADGYASVYNYLLDLLANSRAYSLYSGVNSVLGFAILAVSITDIVLVHRKGYPILGMILFTIFFKPGYFLWRAHVVNQKKLASALFTFFYALLYAGYFMWCVFFVMNLLR